MIQTTTEFEEASIFERTVLASVFPLISTQATRASLDLRTSRATTTIAVSSVGDLGGAAREALINELRPLFFGAAWKVLDLLLELAFHQHGLAPTRPGKWTIAEKEAHAVSNLGSCPPISSDRDIWTRICALYANTVEARHCLVHRRFVLSSLGDMTQIQAPSGALQPDLTAMEQEAFCRTAQSIAAACLASRFTNRERIDLIWWLDQLTRHHRAAPLGGGSPARPVEVVKVDAIHTPSGWTVDLARAHTEVQRVFPGRPYFDVEIYFPGSGFPPLTGRLEEAPLDLAFVIDPASPPSWAVF